MPNESMVDPEQNIVVGVIRDLTTRLEEHERLNNKGRHEFQERVMAIVSELRRDVNRAIIPMQVDHQDHRRSHESERSDQTARVEAERTERSNRQAETDRRFTELHAELRQLRYFIIGSFALIAITVGFLVARFGI
jgi:hypothetical protein